MSPEVSTPQEVLSPKELYLMQDRVEKHELLLNGEDGEGGFVRKTNDFIAGQKGAYRSLQIMISILLAIVAYATFVRGH